MKTLKNRIVLIKDTFPEQIGNIYIPELIGKDHYVPPYTGTIVAVGDTVNDEDLKPGIRVFYHDLAGTEFFIENQKYLILRDIDIIAIIDNNADIY